MAMDEVFKVFGTLGLKNETRAPMEEAEKQAEKSADSVASKFMNAAKWIGGAFAAKGVFDFGKATVEAAATAQAVQAQFDQVFGDIKGKASESLNAVANEIGAIPNRIKPAFNQIASFAKVAGMDANQSLEFTTRATKAAADSAAFYDKSLEDTTETLKSYLKGNFSVADNLGILSTETTRNAKATELFGQKYKDLTGIQQQEVLLKMFEDANKVSGAMGQAARESDGWENVMGNLKQSWTDFQAEIGKAILPTAVKVIQALAGAMRAATQAIGPLVQNVAAFFAELFKGDAPLGQLVNGLGQLVTKAGEAIGKVAGFISQLFGAISSGKGGDFLQSLGISPSVVSTLEGIFSRIGAVIGKFLGVLNGVKEAVIAIFDILFGSMSEGDNYDLLVKLGLPPDAAELVITIAQTIGQVMSDLWNGIMEVAQAASDFYNQHVFPLFDMILQSSSDLYAQGSPLWEALSNAVTLAGQVIGLAIQWIVERVKIMYEQMAVVIDVVRAVWPQIQAVIMSAIQVISDVLAVFIAFFKGDWDGLWKAVQNLASSAWELIKNLFTLAVNALVQIISRCLQAVIKWATDIYNTVKDWFGKIPDAIKSLWKKAEDFLRSINLVEIGKNIVSGLWDGIKSMWGNMVNWVGEKANGFISSVKGVFGIKSPSRRMRDEVGVHLPTGIAAGIEQSAGAIDEAMDDVKSRIMFDPSMAYTVHQNVNVEEHEEEMPLYQRETLALLRALVAKDGNTYLNEREVSRAISEPLNNYNQVNDLQNKRMRGEGFGFA